MGGTSPDVPPIALPGSHSSMRHLSRLHVPTWIASALLLTASSHAAAAVERTSGSPSANPSGRLIISPARIEADAEPGVPDTTRITLTNDSEETFDVSIRSTDVGAAADPTSVAAPVERGEFGAGDWIRAELKDMRLEPFETIEFDVILTPPVDAPVGTNLGGIIVDSTGAEGAIGTADADGAFRVQGLIQTFLTIPGPVDHQLRIRDVDVRTSLLLGSNRFAVWDVTFENRGTVNEHVNGTLDVRSIFGSSADRMPIKEILVLRGGTRTTRIVWRDVPWVGAFTPEVRVRGDDAKPLTAKGERVTVLPWWVPVMIVASIVVPALLLWWRRRREWRRYMDDEQWVDDDAVPDDGTLMR